tara:strand:+ start:387 stop:677 length:291 start_codon:yes stop_codon:yes gene_type:complete
MATKIQAFNLHSNVDAHIRNTITTGPLSGNLVFEGSTADAHETTLTVTDPTADRTVTIPNASGTVITTGNLDDMTQQDHGLITGSLTLTNDFGSIA